MKIGFLFSFDVITIQSVTLALAQFALPSKNLIRPVSLIDFSLKLCLKFAIF
jgi:hypothetical protein